MKIILSLVIAALLCAIGGIVFIYSGAYDVAATVPHNPIVAWVLDTTMVESVRAHARSIQAPALDQPQVVESGAGHYHDDCEICHGGPGVTQSELARGLLPSPPDLGEAAQEWTAAQLFWIVKHGVKMTGMPAWGPTYTDQELWAIVAFIRKLHELSPEQFQKMGHSPTHQSRLGSGTIARASFRTGRGP